MEIKLDPFRSVAKEIDRYLGKREPDYALTAALLTVASPGDLLGAGDGQPALIAWADDEGGRHAVALLGERLFKASIGRERPEGFLGVRQPDSVSIYRRDDVREVSFSGLTRPDVIGSDVSWHAKRWTVRVANDVFWLSEEGMTPHSADRVTTFMRDLMSPE